MEHVGGLFIVYLFSKLWNLKEEEKKKKIIFQSNCNLGSHFSNKNYK